MTKFLISFSQRIKYFFFFQGKTSKILKSFSIYHNWIKLFSTKNSTDTDYINCLDGIRVLSLFFIIFSQSYLYRFVQIFFINGPVMQKVIII